MRVLPALLLLASLAPLGLASHAFPDREGELTLACDGVQLDYYVSLPPVGQGCEDDAFFPTQGATGWYVATLTWTASHDSYGALQACVSTLRPVTTFPSDLRTWTEVDGDCQDGPSPLVVRVPASQQDDRIHLSLTTSTGPAAGRFFNGTVQHVAYALVHES